MPNRTAKPLPKTLPGVVCRQWVRCGRAGCRCKAGQPHGPYFYRFWRQGGRLRKEYVRQGDFAEVHRACQARRVQRAEIRAAWEMIREHALNLKEWEATWKPA